MHGQLHEQSRHKLLRISKVIITFHLMQTLLHPMLLLVNISIFSANGDFESIHPSNIAV